MQKLVIELPAPRRDEASALLFELGAGGVEEVEDGLAVYGEGAEIARLRAGVAQVFPDAGLRVELVPDTWQTAWIEYLRPERVTGRVVLQPASDPTPAPDGAVRLWFEPRMAFGVGSHPTTRLAARAVERFCLAHPGARVLDVGTGNGVLSMVAATSGAARVRGLDVDPEAVAAATANARLNALEEICRFEATPLADVGAADLVVANIDAPTLIALAPALCAAVAPGGTLLLTGVLAEHSAAVAEAFAAPCLAPDRQDQEDDYVLLQLVRSLDA